VVAVTLALFGVLLLAGLQGGAVQQPAAKSSANCTIEGTILAGDTGQPLRKAWVILDKAEGRGTPQTAVADASGHFVLKDIEPGRYHLAAARTGYVRQQYGERGTNSAGTTLALSPGQQLREISFRLIRAAAISGHIFDEDGDPIEGAGINALKYGYYQGRRRLLPVGWARTDDLGEYRLYGLAPGQYVISAGQNSNQTGDQAGRPGFAPSYYPGTADPADATPVTVRGGDDFPGVDFNLQPVRTVSVSGRVFNSITGRPGVGTNIFFSPRRADQAPIFSFGFQTYVQDAQGDFKIANVIPGSYYLIGLTTVEGKQYTSRVPIEVGDADLTGINLVISAGVTLKGRVEGLGKTDVTAMQISLMSRDQQIYFGAGTMATPKPDGSFAITNVTDGSYEVNLWPLPEDAYIKDIREGDQSILTSGLDITGGQVPGDLEILLSPNGGRVDGTVVKDNKSFSGATVVLVPDDPAMRKNSRWYKQATTDQYGSFSLRGVRPGDYKIFAWEKVEPGAYEDPAFLKPFEDQGKAVESKESGQVNLQLSLIAETQPE
jgi:Carboxypeptidase regulatory-like domain